VISFGALSAFSVVNLCVVKQFLIDERRRGIGSALLYGLVPLIGFASTVWLWLSLSRSALIVGAGWLTLGIVYLLVSRPKLKIEGV
jgi:putrescine importer